MPGREAGDTDSVSYHYLSLATSQQLDVWFKTGSNLSQLEGASGVSLLTKHMSSNRQQSAQNDQYTFELPPGLSMAAGRNKSDLEGEEVGLKLPPSGPGTADGTQNLSLSAHGTSGAKTGPFHSPHKQVCRLQSSLRIQVWGVPLTPNLRALA